MVTELDVLSGQNELDLAWRLIPATLRTWSEHFATMLTSLCMYEKVKQLIFDTTQVSG